MTDGPVVTSYPHERLGRIADAMGDVLDQQQDAGDVRAIILLNDADGGCVHLHRYETPGSASPHTAEVFVDMVAQLMELGTALGVRVQVLAAGQAVETRERAE